MANVIKLDKTAVDISATMRDVADAIEAGEYGDVQFVGAVLIPENCQPPTVFMWGKASNLELIGAFNIAHHWILVPRT